MPITNKDAVLNKLNKKLKMHTNLKFTLDHRLVGYN